ncbi:MAG: DUF401 family protein [Clostridia bacterium]|nr:DUF401 family protein [Clostridia bacterium]
MLIIGLIVTFSLILILVTRKVPIGMAVLFGGVILALFAGLRAPQIIKIILLTFTQKGTQQLILTVVLISILSTMMQEYGIMDLMIKYLEKTFKSIKTLLFIIPSLLSTFTASGAAIIAAPIIDGLGDRAGLSGPKKAAINLYIRHAWYFMLPIAVNLINASYISNIPIKQLAFAQAPVSLICLITGYLVYLHPLKNTLMENVAESENKEQKEKPFLKAFLYTSPILLCVLLVFFIPSYLALLAGCLLAYFIRQKNIPFARIVLNKRGWPLIQAAAGVMIFKNFIENIPELKLLLEQVINLGIPLEIVIIIMTVLAGYVAANLTVVTGLLYPLILPLVSPEQVLPTAALIYTLGYCSYFISPIHLCQALTNEYFQVEMKDLYKEYKITVPVMFLASLFTYLLIR